MIYKHTGIWMWQGSESVISWNWNLLSFQTGFNLFGAAVVCAILESISGLEPSSDTTEPRYLKLVTVPSFCHLLWSLFWCCWCCLSSAWSSWHWSPCHRLWRLCWDTQLLLPFLLPLLLSPSMSSAKQRLVIVLPPLFHHCRRVHNALTVFMCILAHFCIPVSLHNKNVLHWCLINDIL